MISLQFSTQNSVISATIRRLTRAWCSHVDAVLPDGSLLGAHVEDGVLIRKPDYAAFTKKLRVDLAADEDISVAFYSFLHEQVGKPYDKSAILAFVANRDWQEADSWFCSELCAAALLRSGFFPYELSVATNRISPANLLLVCSAFAPTQG